MDLVIELSECHALEEKFVQCAKDESVDYAFSAASSSQDFAAANNGPETVAEWKGCVDSLTIDNASKASWESSEVTTSTGIVTSMLVPHVSLQQHIPHLRDGRMSVGTLSHAYSK